MVKKLKGRDADQCIHYLVFAAWSVSVLCHGRLKWFICVEHYHSFLILGPVISRPWHHIPDLGSRVTIASSQVLAKQPTAFAVLLYTALMGILKYVYLITYLKCRDFLFKGHPLVSLTWLEMGKTKVQAAQPPTLLSIQTCLWALEQDPRVFHVDVLLWSVQNISCALVVRIW